MLRGYGREGHGRERTGEERAEGVGFFVGGGGGVGGAGEVVPKSRVCWSRCMIRQAGGRLGRGVRWVRFRGGTVLFWVEILGNQQR